MKKLNAIGTTRLALQVLRHRRLRNRSPRFGQWLEPLEPRMLLSAFTSVASGDWSDPSTWDQSGVPGAGDSVIIAAAHDVTLDQNIAGILGDDTTGGLLIQGKLTFDANTSLELHLDENLHIDGGELEMRPASASVVHSIIFDNIDETEFVGGGMMVLATDVGLWITGDGILDAIGSDKTPWTRLTGSASASDTIITVQDATGWQIGDALVITPTQSPGVGSASWNGYDERTITAISGNTITLSAALTHDHPEVNNTWTAEVLNLTRNVKIGGTGDGSANPATNGRAHMMFLMTDQPQTVRNVELHHMGPRMDPDGDGRTEGVPGRYGIHFHFDGDGSRGSLVENVVVRDTGGHAFVPHASHGITMRGTVSHNTWDAAYWWDKSTDNSPTHANATHDVIWDQAVASKVRVDPSFRGYRLTGFQLGWGLDNTITNSVSVGIQGNKDASGFEWPENSDSSPWTFNNNIGHNNKVHGIFTWHNGGSFHLVEDFVMYHNGNSGVDHGAYGNRYTYRNAQLYGNGYAGFQLHNVSGNDVVSPMLIENMQIDGAGVSDFGFAIQSHNTQVALAYPTTLRNNSVTNLATGGKAYAWIYSGIASGPGDPGGEDHSFGNHREWFKLINNSYDGSYDDYFFLEGFWNDRDSDGVIDWTDTDGDGYLTMEDGGEKFGIIGADGATNPLGADIHVQMPDGEVFKLYSIWEENQALSSVSAWNAKKEQIAAPGTPIVDGGGNRSTTLPYAVHLDANVIDNGIHNPAGITTWTKVSGPGTVTFDDASAIDTSAGFSAVGHYVLRLTANDGTYTGSSDVRVYVTAANSSGSTAEDFTGTSGDPWPSQWTQQDFGGATSATTIGGEGRFTSPSGDTSSLMYINTHNAQDVDLTTDFRLGGNSTRVGLFARRSDHNPDTYYGARTDASHNARTEIFKVVDGVRRTIASIASTTASNVDYTMRFRVTTNGDGTDKLELKIWQAGTPEPAEWNLAVDESMSITGIIEPALNGASGRFGILAGLSNANRQVYVDNFSAEVLDQPPTVAETFTGDSGDPWPGQWTREDLGGVAPVVSIQNNAGRIHNGGSSGSVLMYINSAVAEDVDQTVTMSVTNNSTYPMLIARRADADPDTYYQVRVGSGAGSNPKLRISKIVDGVETQLAQTSDQIASNTAYHFRFLVQSDGSGGTNLHAKFWAVGTTEPASWMIQKIGDTESRLQDVSGRFGLKGSVGVNNRRIDFDDYHADILSSGGALRAEGGERQAGHAPAITQAQLDPIIIEAWERWIAAGVDTGGLALEDLTFSIADLGGDLLGQTIGTIITLDVNAANHGWFIDATPATDHEFNGRRGPAGIDLLSVVLHEIGHALGLDHGDAGLGSATLAPGIRLTPVETGDGVDLQPITPNDHTLDPAPATLAHWLESHRRGRGAASWPLGLLQSARLLELQTL